MIGIVGSDAHVPQNVGDTFIETSQEIADENMKYVGMNTAGQLIVCYSDDNMVKKDGDVEIRDFAPDEDLSEIAQAVSGNRVVLKDGVSGESKKTVNVEEYKRPKFSASFDDAPENAVLGSPVTVSGSVTSWATREEPPPPELL